MRAKGGEEEEEEEECQRTLTYLLPNEFKLHSSNVSRSNLATELPMETIFGLKLAK